MGCSRSLRNAICCPCKVSTDPEVNNCMHNSLRPGWRSTSYGYIICLCMRRGLQGVRVNLSEDESSGGDSSSVQDRAQLLNTPLPCALLDPLISFLYEHAAHLPPMLQVHLALPSCCELSNERAFVVSLWVWDEASACT